MFEVGKKLIDKDKERIVEILFVTDKNIMVRYTKNSIPRYVGKEYCWCQEDIRAAGWKEYHEPVAVRTIGYVTDTKRGYYKTENTRFSGCVGSFIYTVTDGKLTDVRIV